MSSAARKRPRLAHAGDAEGMADVETLMQMEAALKKQAAEVERKKKALDAAREEHAAEFEREKKALDAAREEHAAEVERERKALDAAREENAAKEAELKKQAAALKKQARVLKQQREQGDVASLVAAAIKESVDLAAKASASAYGHVGWVSLQGLAFGEDGLGGSVAREVEGKIPAYRCGRPYRIVAELPAPLVCEAFAIFVDTFETTAEADIPAFMMDRAVDLCASMANAHRSEASRENEATDILNAALGYHVRAFKGTRAATDGSVVRLSGTDSYLLLNNEVKNYLTGARSDAYMQNLHHYALLTSGAAARFQPAPAFLMSIIDNMMHISCAYRDVQPCCQPLIQPVWLMRMPGTNAGEVTVARALYALRQGMQALDAWYVEGVAGRLSSQFRALPWSCNLPSVTIDDSIKGGTLVYKGTYGSTKQPAFIKFVQRYGEEAHRAAVALKLAPVLHACTPVKGGWHAVVMEMLDGSAWVNMKALMADKARKGRAIEAAHLLAKRVKTLHNAGFVHGDLHQKNVMVTTCGTVDVRVVDWDWSGSTGVTRYPPLLNFDMLYWATGVKPGAVVQPEHDSFLVSRAEAGTADMSPAASPAVSPSKPVAVVSATGSAKKKASSKKKAGAAGARAGRKRRRREAIETEETEE